MTSPPQDGDTTTFARPMADPTSGSESDPERPRVVSIVGPSDAGKTTLIERLVPVLEGRVASVKSIHHDVEPDEPGKDTHRHRDAGAERVVGVTPSLTFSVRTRGKHTHEAGPSGVLEELLDQLTREGYDYVLVEGFSDAPLPKLVVGTDDEFESHVLAHISNPKSVDVAELANLVSGQSK